MENIHNIESKPWISSEKICISDLLKTWTELQVDRELSIDIQESVNSDPYYAELNSLIDNFAKKCTTDEYYLPTTKDSIKVSPKCDLRTYLQQLEHARRIYNDRAYRVQYMSTFRTTRDEFMIRRHLERDTISTNDHQSHDFESSENSTALVALITIQIWTKKPRLEREVIVRSDQTLDVLRHHFKCAKDFTSPMDLSDNPSSVNDAVNAGEIFKSGFYLIGDTFYNDMSHPTNADLSQVAIDWANATPERGIGPFKSKTMEYTRFDELTLRLGYPYLYQHQGDCEHLFTFSDIEITRDNYAPTSQYPRVTLTSFGKGRVKCNMCRSRPAHWVTRGNDRLPTDPFFFCQDCFLSFNYDRGGKKVGQFKAYPYTNNIAIPESASV